MKGKPYILLALAPLIVCLIAVVSETERTTSVNGLGGHYATHLEGHAPPFLVKEHNVYATLTSYNPVPEQTDSTPNVMASGNRVYEGAIACPRWLPFGTIIEINGKDYICEDRMNEKYKGWRFDILRFDLEEAKQFGVQRKHIKVKLIK